MKRPAYVLARPAYMDDDNLYSDYIAENAEVLGKVLGKFVPQPALIADVTYNAGSFWRGYKAPIVDLQRLATVDGWDVANLGADGLKEWKKAYKHWSLPVWGGARPERGHLVVASDLLIGVDCRVLPYRDGELDALVLDLPYAGQGGRGGTCKSCGGAGCGRCNGTGEVKASGSGCISGFGNGMAGSRSTKVISGLYVQALEEARRVVCPKGICVVKIQDQIESQKQRYLSHDIIHAHTWLCEQDVTVTSPTKPRMRHNYQLHARRNNSVFVVLRKLTERQVANAARKQAQQETAA